MLELDPDIGGTILTFVLVLTLLAGKCVSKEFPGRLKLLAVGIITAWGVRMIYESNLVVMVNLGVWLLFYNTIVDDDDHDHGHSHGHSN